jgi:hypothetical protein
MKKQKIKTVDGGEIEELTPENNEEAVELSDQIEAGEVEAVQSFADDFDADEEIDEFLGFE